MWPRHNRLTLRVAMLLTLLLAGRCTRPIGTVFDHDEVDAGPLVCSALGGAEDGPTWPYFRGTRSRRGEVGQRGPQQGVVAWFHEVDGPGFTYSSPVVGSQGTIYLARDGSNPYRTQLLAIRNDGTREWSVPLDSNWCWSSPAIAPDGTILIGTGGSMPDGRARLLAVSPSGSVLWRIPLACAIYSSPVIDNTGTIYIASYSFGGPPDYPVWNMALHALTPDGAVRWSLDLDQPMEGSPALGADCTIYAATWEELLAVSHEGNILWRVDTGPARGISTVAFGTPVVAWDGAIYLAAHSFSLFAVTAAGDVLWELPTDEGHYLNPALPPAAPASPGSPALYAVLAGDGLPGVLRALSAGGETLWELPLLEECSSSPVVGSDGTIYVMTYKGTLYAVRPDGTTLWTQPVDGRFHGSPALSEGRLYIGSSSEHDGRPGLYAIGP